MSLRALPLMVIPLVVYNIVVVFAGGGPATGPLGATLFRLPMLSGATWTFNWGDLIILMTLLVLFTELVKATYTSSISLVDHGLVDGGVHRLPRRVSGGRRSGHVGVLLHFDHCNDRRGCGVHDRHPRRPPRSDNRGQPLRLAATQPARVASVAISIELSCWRVGTAICCRRKASRASTGWWRAAP